MAAAHGEIILSQQLLNQNVRAVTLLDDELFVTNWNTEHVSVYDSTTLEENRTIPIPGIGVQPFGLAVHPVNKLLFVSDYVNKRVHVVDLSSDDVITSWNVDVQPVGLSMSTKHNVIVTSGEEIGEYSTTGALIRRVQCYKYFMYQAVDTRNETLIVSSTGRSLHGIAELSWEGNVLRRYGNQQYGSGPGQMNSPTGLALDSKGNVLVCDWGNNRKQVLNSTLTTARSLQLPVNVNRPLAVCFDESRGRLYVGERGGEKRLLMFVHVTNLGSMFVTLSQQPLNQNGVPAVTLFDDELFVTNWNTKHVSVYDSTTLEKKRTIRIPGIGDRPFGLAVHPKNKLLFVSDYDNNRVHRVDLSSDDVITSWNVADEPRGLSMSTKHNVIVTSREEIEKYSTTGAWMRGVRCDKYDMWQAVETRNKTLIVSSSGSLVGIAELSWEGNVLRCYGNQQRGSGQGQMNSPMGLALDSKGNVLVCDQFNNRIQVLNSSLTTARSLQLPVNVNGPRAVCFDESRGRLYVGEWSGEKRLLMFE